jgi:hypothetical protein
MVADNCAAEAAQEAETDAILVVVVLVGSDAAVGSVSSFRGRFLEGPSFSSISIFLSELILATIC